MERFKKYEILVLEMQTWVVERKCKTEDANIVKVRNLPISSFAVALILLSLYNAA